MFPIQSEDKDILAAFDERPTGTRRQLLTWYTHVLMSLLILLNIGIIATGVQTFINEFNTNGTTIFYLMLVGVAGLMIFCCYVITGMILLWSGWKHAVVFS